MLTVLDVAYYIITKLNELPQYKLQKLTYYCQVWSLVWDKKPLFNEDFEAWKNGPINRELFNICNGRYLITSNIFTNINKSFNPNQIDTMNVVIHDLGKKDSQWLSDLVKSEEPYINARGNNIDEECSNIITKKSMYEYYAKIYERDDNKCEYLK